MNLIFDIETDDLDATKIWCIVAKQVDGQVYKFGPNQIEDALDYKKIGKSIVNLVENSSFFLVEKMAEEIAKLVLKNKQIKDISLKVEKPGALRGSKSVGVDIFRRQR